VGRVNRGTGRAPFARFLIYLLVTLLFLVTFIQCRFRVVRTRVFTRSRCCRPASIRSMSRRRLFDSEARRNNVYPLVPYPALQPTPNPGEKSFVYRAGIGRISANAAPHVVGRPHRITAEVEVPAAGAEGVILAQGGIYGGYTLFVKDSRVGYEVNASGNRAGSLLSSEPLQNGKSQIVLDSLRTRADRLPGCHSFSLADRESRACRSTASPPEKRKSPVSEAMVCTLKLWMLARIWARR